MLFQYLSAFQGNQPDTANCHKRMDIDWTTNIPYILTTQYWFGTFTIIWCIYYFPEGNLKGQYSGYVCGISQPADVPPLLSNPTNTVIHLRGVGSLNDQHLVHSLVGHVPADIVVVHICSYSEFPWTLNDINLDTTNLRVVTAGWHQQQQQVAIDVYFVLIHTYIQI